MKQRDVVLDSSPLAQYMASQNIDAEACSPTDLAPVTPTPLSPTDSFWNGLFRRRRARTRLAAFDAAYARVLGDEGYASLERDFGDVASGLREERPPLAWEKLVGGVTAAVVGVAVGFLTGYWGLAGGVVAMAGVVAIQRRRRRDEGSPPEAIERAEVAAARLLARAKKAVGLVREVELVVRGYRVGATVQSPVSLVEAGEARHLVQLREVCRETLVAICAQAKLLLLAMRSNCSALVKADIDSTVAMSDAAVDSSSSSIQSLSTMLRVAEAVRTNVSLIALRVSLFGVDLPDFDGYVSACVLGADRIRDVLQIDWRPKKKKVNERGRAVLHPSIAALQSGLRTIGAKSVLFEELLLVSDGNDARVEDLKKSISVELANLASEWEFRNRPKPINIEPAVQPASVANEVETVSYGNLDIDVIGAGGGRETGKKVNAAELSDLLQVYEGRARNDDEPERKPMVPREERIRLMYERKAAEEAAHAEKRVVSTLMSELENVLQAKK